MLLLLLPAWGQQGLGCWELLLRQVLLQLNRSTEALLASQGRWGSTEMQPATLETLLTQGKLMGWGSTLLLLVALSPEGPPLSPCLRVRKFRIHNDALILNRTGVAQTIAVCPVAMSIRYLLKRYTRARAADKDHNVVWQRTEFTLWIPRLFPVFTHPAAHPAGQRKGLLISEASSCFCS